MRIAACFPMLALAFLPGIALAYEDDVHYGLTRWLAQSAGFSAADADAIARANVDYDHSDLSAIKLVHQSACFVNRDSVVSQLVQRLHFPGEGNVPGEPAARRVGPGSPAASSEYRKAILVPAAAPDRDLLLFGQSLHSLQDSWSHQGEPEPPLDPYCDRQLSWGHIAARGGWRRHDADLSHLYVNDAVQMAAATYGALCEYRNARGWTECQAPISAFAAPALQLLQARTKVEKAKWFREHGFDDVRFVSSINVDGRGMEVTPDAIDYSSAALLPLRKSKRNAMPNTPEAQFMTSFFSEWMTRKDLDNLAKERIAIEAFRDPLGQGDARAIELASATTQLMFWRVRDHGSLRQPLEGVHDWITRRVGAVPSAIRDGDLPYVSLEDALLPLDPSGIPIATWVARRRDGATLWIGAARLRLAPHDLVIVTASKVQGRDMVISINSLVTK